MSDIWSFFDSGIGRVTSLGGSALVGGVLSHFGFRINEGYKRRLAKSEVHLCEIKEKVLQRTISVIADHWISMARFTRSPIRVSWKHTIEPAKSVKDKSVEIQSYVIEPESPANEQYFQKKELQFTDNRWMYEIDHVLYSDARQNHYPELFREVDECEKLVGEYQRVAVEQAQTCARVVSNLAGLPEYLNNNGSPYWIRAARMAKYVADKALGIEKHHLYSTTDQNSVLVRISGTQDEFFKVENGKEVDKLFALLDAQIASFPVSALGKIASQISESGEGLLKKLNTLRGSEKLPDKCSLQWPR